jgi:hypothetical protein
VSSLVGTNEAPSRAPRGFAKVATTITLVAAAGALLALGTEILLEGRWADLTCGDGRTVTLDRLVLTALVCAVLAVLAGIVALVGRTANRGRVVAGVLIAVIVAAALVVAPAVPWLPGDVGSYVCGISTA